MVLMEVMVAREITALMAVTDCVVVMVEMVLQGRTERMVRLEVEVRMVVEEVMDLQLERTLFLQTHKEEPLPVLREEVAEQVAEVA